MMQWQKVGRIFSPAQHTLPMGCFAFAKSPQAVVFDRFVRVYFSSCRRDESGKYLSHVCYADYTPDFGAILDVAQHQVLPLGELGAFDEHGIFPVHIYREGNELRAYTTGWSRRVSVSAESSIGLAISRDQGRTFEKIGPGPILSASLHEPFLVADGFVLKIAGTYHMWYIYGQRWINGVLGGQAERVYKISHATSDDGVVWTRTGCQPIPDSLGPDECQALPSVLEVDGVYHMVFCYRDAIGFRTEPGKGYRLGYAYSRDLLNWQRDDGVLGLEPSGSGWDGEMMCYPHIFRAGNRIALLYNGNGFGLEGFGLAYLESEINEHMNS